MKCGQNCQDLWVLIYQGLGNKQKGYLDEAKNIYDKDDLCCYDPLEDMAELGASGIKDSQFYFNNTHKTFIDV